MASDETRGPIALIGLDWGTSRLRAYLFDAAGTVIAAKAHPWGVLAMPDSDFGAAYAAITGPWEKVAPGVAVIAAGMIGSTEGWVRAPYVPCPAGPRELGAALVETKVGNGRLFVIPGVDQHAPQSDVMRGEETQIAGALALRPELAAGATLILPGTHAKWAAVHDGRIVSFTTYMTGELFALLRDHSILGRPARKAAAQGETNRVVAWEAFDRGVATARDSGTRGIAPVLFGTRSLVLHEELRARDSLDYLSGLLIGDELRSALSGIPQQPALIGEEALCERYARALQSFGASVTIVPDSSAAGLWSVACAAGLAAPAATHV
jgi:2-dehydro-3-deoxygalactonokinase